MSDKNGSEGRIQWSRFFKKLSPYMIQKGLLYLKHYGPREFWIRLHERFEPEEIPYGPWYAAYVPDQTVLDKQRKKKICLRTSYQRGSSGLSYSGIIFAADDRFTGSTDL